MSRSTLSFVNCMCECFIFIFLFRHHHHLWPSDPSEDSVALIPHLGKHCRGDAKLPKWVTFEHQICKFSQTVLDEPERHVPSRLARGTKHFIQMHSHSHTFRECRLGVYYRCDHGYAVCLDDPHFAATCVLFSVSKRMQIVQSPQFKCRFTCVCNLCANISIGVLRPISCGVPKMGMGKVRTGDEMV